MNCPHCNKEIYGLTGLQELQKFQKHLSKCKKNPKNRVVVEPDGSIEKLTHKPDLLEALNIRHESGQ